MWRACQASKYKCHLSSWRIISGGLMAQCVVIELQTIAAASSRRGIKAVLQVEGIFNISISTSRRRRRQPSCSLSINRETLLKLMCEAARPAGARWGPGALWPKNVCNNDVSFLASGTAKEKCIFINKCEAVRETPWLSSATILSMYQWNNIIIATTNVLYQYQMPILRINCLKINQGSLFGLRNWPLAQNLWGEIGE